MRNQAYKDSMEIGNDLKKLKQRISKSQRIKMGMGMHWNWNGELKMDWFTFSRFMLSICLITV